jgi:pimeloyl-ACP methyl ester carboxylesterase
VKINLPSGHRLNGKWWGNKSLRPFLCIHGWQDNAGSFDRIIPLLPRNHSYLAIDLIGHGLSSRLPNGVNYHSIDHLNQILELSNEYGWEKVSLISHSLGAILSFLFASIFPKNVDMLIGIEGLKPTINDPVNIANSLEKKINNFMLADKRNRESTEPPSYSIEEMAEKMEIATRKSVTKECAPYLLRRNIKKSEKLLNKYYFNRDSRLKYGIGEY